MYSASAPNHPFQSSIMTPLAIHFMSMFIKAVVSYTNKKENPDAPTYRSGVEFEGGIATKTLVNEAKENGAKCCYMYNSVIFKYNMISML